MKLKSKLFIILLFSFTTSFGQRLVLLEQFTNASCPYCGMYTPPVCTYVRNNLSQVIMIAYHTNFPHFDSLYFENPIEVDDRVAYYNVQGTPYSTIDGNIFSGPSATLLNTISTTIPNRAVITPEYFISFSNCQLNGNQVDIQIIFTSLNNNSGQNLKARIAVVEEPVYKADYNGASGTNIETEYPYSMRKMLPDAIGTTLLNTFLNGSDTITQSWTATNFKNVNRMKVIAFVQNETTKEILQSAITIPSGVTGMNNSPMLSANWFTLYPLPAKTSFSIKFSSIQTEVQLEIFDLLGNRITDQHLSDKQETVFNTSKLKNGVYFVKISKEGKSETKKLVVMN